MSQLFLKPKGCSGKREEYSSQNVDTMVRGTCSMRVGDRNCVHNFISNSESRVSPSSRQRRLECIENYLK
jgi:hypothetical protein